MNFNVTCNGRWLRDSFYVFPTLRTHQSDQSQLFLLLPSILRLQNNFQFRSHEMDVIHIIGSSSEACTFGALVNQTRRSYTDLTCPFGILEAYTFGRVNLSKNYLTNGIRPRLLSAAER